MLLWNVGAASVMHSKEQGGKRKRYKQLLIGGEGSYKVVSEGLDRHQRSADGAWLRSQTQVTDIPYSYPKGDHLIIV